MSDCLICRSQVKEFISFGPMPVANGFLTPEEFAQERFFPLNVGLCPACKMVQLTERVDPGTLFHEGYPYFSSTSRSMSDHFQAFAGLVMAEYIDPADPFVVEIGSNDGIMLQHFAGAGIRHLGIEPSANVARVGMDKGINTVCEFFDQDLARSILDQHGPVDAFLGANVMCHIAELDSVLAGIKLLLKPEGVLIFEDPYLGDIVEKTSYDQMYDEHIFYFSVTSLSHALEKHGLELVDIMPQKVHGGSMRYVVAPSGARPVSPSVTVQCAREDALGLGMMETYEGFSQSVEASRKELMALLHDLKGQGKRVVGYGATSKSTTVINYCGITAELVGFISDTTPDKQGRYTPGAHIPVRPYKEFQTDYPDYSLLFAWNHAEEIMANEQSFTGAGGKWIVYVPKVQVL